MCPICRAHVACLYRRGAVPADGVILVSVTIVIPAYNEGARIRKSLDGILRVAEQFDISEIVVVDDGSSDGTADAVSQVGSDARVSVRLMQHEVNRGKGAAIRTGIFASCGESIALLDADLSVSPVRLSDAETVLLSGADIVIGKRVSLGKHHQRDGQPLLRRILGHMFVALQQRIVGLAYEDTQCPFKVLTRDAAVSVFSECRVDGWAFDVEMLVVAQRQGWVIQEVPVLWQHVNGSRMQSTPTTIWRTLKELLLIRRRQHAQALIATDTESL